MDEIALFLNGILKTGGIHENLDMIGKIISFANSFH